MTRYMFSTISLPGALALMLGISLFIMGLSVGRTPTAQPVTLEGEPPRVVARPGEAAPDFSLVTPSGSPNGLSDFLGRPVVLFFWASWCRYCEADIPKLTSALEQHEAGDLTFLAINIMESPETVAQYVREAGLSLTVLLDTDGAVSQQYNVRAMPTYFFIDREGVLKNQIIGQIRPNVLQAQLRTITSS